MWSHSAADCDCPSQLHPALPRPGPNLARRRRAAQGNLLASLHGASALLAQRTPLLLAHSFVQAYPYIPDMVKAMQIGAQIYLPKIFFEAGIGLSPDEISAGFAGLADTLRRMSVALRG